MNLAVKDPFNINFFKFDISASAVINLIFPLLLVVAGIIAIVFILWGSMMMLSARGDTEVLEKGLATIRNSLTGLVIIIIVIILSALLGGYLGFDFMNFQNFVDFIDSVNYVITDWRLKL